MTKQEAINEIEEYLRDADKAISEDEEYIRGWKSAMLVALEIVNNIYECTPSDLNPNLNLLRTAIDEIHLLEELLGRDRSIHYEQI